MSTIYHMITLVLDIWINIAASNTLICILSMCSFKALVTKIHWISNCKWVVKTHNFSIEIPTNFTLYGQRIVAARMGSVAFFAEEISTSPRSWQGPFTKSLSINLPRLRCLILRIFYRFVPVVFIGLCVNLRMKLGCY